MDKEKIIDVVQHVKDKSNKDLFESRDVLLKEFNATKDLIIELTRHLDAVQASYEEINDEIGRRIS
jgi:hypothetical protein